MSQWTMGGEFKVGVCIPTCNGARELRPASGIWAELATKVHRAMIVDSSSGDGTVDLMRSIGFSCHVIPGIEFDHGGTRQMAVEMLDDCDVVVFLTQDAVPTSPESIGRLVDAFRDPEVVIAYGRQLPRPGAGPIEAHARIFGYPAESRIKSKDSIPEIGLRAAVVSNSFAAYRRSALMALGGFPKGTLFGEDTLTGAKAILAGHKIAYVGDATVHHSHGYSLWQEFRRYFDNGAFYSRERWILDAFGKAEGSGKAYVISEMKYLLKHAPWLLPRSAATVLVKYAGYRVGSMEARIPSRLKLRMSTNKAYWRREIASGK